MILSLEYIAGLFDGEGSIVIGKTGPREHELAVTITNNYRPVLLEVAEQFQGAVNLNRKCYIYRAGHSAAETLLRAIRPFLRIKAIRADLALEFRRTFIVKSYRLSDTILEEREWFREEMMRLNKGME